MERNKLFRRYRNKLIIESLLKSAICGFAIGFFVSIIPAIITIIYNANGLLYCLAVGLGVGVIATAIFYFVMFRPTQLQVANRIDRLGLKERAITMMELEGNESFMANLQRQDAQQWITAASPKKIKFSIFKVPLIILASVMVCAVTMTTISATSVEPPVKYISNLWTDVIEPPKDVDFVNVRYYVNGGMGGDILNYAFQEIPAGSDAEPVVAQAWPGYIFLGWQTEDGDLLFTPERTDRRVIKDLTAYAAFLPMGDPDPNEPPEEDPYDVKEINYIKDGTTYYGYEFDQYYKDVKDYLSSSGDSLTPEQRAFIELYFQTMDRLK